jgi:hypothetical protein
MNTLNTKSANTHLDDTDLELVSGGAHSLGDTLHRLWFAASCVLGGQTLTVKGDQLQCHG